MFCGDREKIHTKSSGKGKGQKTCRHLQPEVLEEESLDHQQQQQPCQMLLLLYEEAGLLCLPYLEVSHSRNPLTFKR